MLGYDETNPRPMQCNPRDRHRCDRGLGTESRLIIPQTKNRAGDSERLPAPHENQTRALQSSLHPLSAPTPSRAARRLKPQSTDRSRPSAEARKLVECPQPDRYHYRQSIKHAITLYASSSTSACEFRASQKCSTSQDVTSYFSLRSLSLSFRL